MRPKEFCFMTPETCTFALAISPDAVADSDNAIDIFQEIEDLGFSECLIPDRPTHHEPSFDALSMMAAAAASTTKLGIIGVCITPYRNPVLLAKSLATTSYLSKGRLILAAALGGDYSAETNVFGISSNKELPKRLEEGIDICRALWSGNPVNYNGRYHQLSNLQQLPKSPHIPIWLAHRARSQTSISRTATIADGWLASWVSPKRLGEAREEIYSQAAPAGRDPKKITVACLVRIRLDRTVEIAVEKMAMARVTHYGHSFNPDLVSHLQIGGPPDVCISRINEFIAAGAQKMIIQLECEPNERAEQLIWLMKEVLRPGDTTHPALIRS